MSNGHFNLRSWSSNSPEVRTRAQHDGDPDKVTLVNVLGLLWDTSQDTLQLVDKPLYSLKFHDQPRKCFTRSDKGVWPTRNTNSSCNIGEIVYATAVAINFKCNKPLTPALVTKWQRIALDLKQTSTLCLPRQHIKFESNNQLVLHTFADASLKAYGAVVFICSNTNSSFVMTKAWLAPLKNFTLPRLELRHL